MFLEFSSWCFYTEYFLDCLLACFIYFVVLYSAYKSYNGWRRLQRKVCSLQKSIFLCNCRFLKITSDTVFSSCKCRFFVHILKIISVSSFFSSASRYCWSVFYSFYIFAWRSTLFSCRWHRSS